MSWGHDLYEFHIRLGGEDTSVTLECGTIRLEVNVFFQIIDEYDSMRISHGNHADFPLLSIACVDLFQHAVALGVGGKSRRNGWSIQNWLSLEDSVSMTPKERIE